MIPQDGVESSYPKGEIAMKKLMTLMLGLSIGLGATALLAQNQPKENTKMEKKKKMKKSKKKPAKKEAEQK
jgi:hypothetical protein